MGMLWRNGCDGKVLRCGAGDRHQHVDHTYNRKSNASPLRAKGDPVFRVLSLRGVPQILVF
jgi:hypothetical protein